MASKSKATRDDHSAFATKKLGHKCGNCNITGKETTLKICARCKTIQYCSRDCQKAHWKTHKDICNRNAEHAAAVVEADQNGFGSTLLPPGISFKELDERLEKWIKFHHSTLMATIIHGLALPRDLKRSRTHVIQMKVCPRLDHNGVSGKFFRVLNAEAVEISTARGFSPVWEESLEQMRTLREESEGKRQGTVAAIGVECEPLGVQFVPFGSLRDLSPIRILPNWKELLIG
ncbi:hypothetical protein Hypma_005012 [Hypsizygus marmoreus]|uniref:MYND-type domain-containing protein n=1 Tax=Hypsizygus marmoreus TaxID=39966 RepID=A0A369JX50_HYPMA|nr:hypothetical protein Hypma_005012 [Hypsizygus marmoreus]